MLFRQASIRIWSRHGPLLVPAPAPARHTRTPQQCPCECSAKIDPERLFRPVALEWSRATGTALRVWRPEVPPRSGRTRLHRRTGPSRTTSDETYQKTRRPVCPTVPSADDRERNRSWIESPSCDFRDLRDKRAVWTLTKARGQDGRQVERFSELRQRHHVVAKLSR